MERCRSAILRTRCSRKSLRLRRGPDFREQRVRKMADLHRSMLGSKDEVSRGWWMRRGCLYVHACVLCLSCVYMVCVCIAYV
ncbi:hypothetical protein EON64_13370 [archaeon]|nr:MAG: hypothetical protein EON64_13370 [archaeon]